MSSELIRTYKRLPTNIALIFVAGYLRSMNGSLVPLDVFEIIKSRETQVTGMWTVPNIIMRLGVLSIVCQL
jgi:hypothetical protein